MLSGYKKTLDDMTWSFSRLHMYEVCPYAFYLKYILEERGISNFYAENGKAMHEVLCGVALGELQVENAISEYLSRFDLICETALATTMDKTCEKCCDYLCELSPIDPDKYEVIGAEVKLDFEISGYKFVGYADLILKDLIRLIGILEDHKSADHFFKKDGITPLSNQKDNFIAYSKQMYLYCKGIEAKYGFLPDECVWNHFKDGGKTSRIPFDEDEYLKTQEWAISIIKKIYKDKTFQANPQYFMCKHLCDYREDCDYKTRDD